MTKIYHRDVFMPDGSLVGFVDAQWNLVYTKHALRELVNDRFGPVTHAPRSIRFTEDDVVEIEAEREYFAGMPVSSSAIKTTKIVVRVDYDDERDLILVLRRFDDGAAIVITAWTNNIGDNHNTLNRNKYATN